jgi:2-amino-4-hydroxy-6-hydroxymethyldihydropteridine diphosphokinase
VTHVVLSLGSNIDREKNIRFACKKISERFGEMEMSPIYETDSIGFAGPSFFNFILGIFTTEPILEIREFLRGIETAAGRIRGKKEFDNRILDIDVVLFGDYNLRPEGLNIPRDEIEKYAYILKPLSDLYPSLKHPISGKAFKQMWLEFDHTQQLELSDFVL